MLLFLMIHGLKILRSHPLASAMQPPSVPTEPLPPQPVVAVSAPALVPVLSHDVDRPSMLSTAGDGMGGSEGLRG
jgi:hypothetical protein